MRPWKWTTRSPHDPSFSPDRAQRELRKLTRFRKSLVDERSAEVNRLQKTLEGATIKLASRLLAAGAFGFPTDVAQGDQGGRHGQHCAICLPCWGLAGIAITKYN